MKTPDIQMVVKMGLAAYRHKYHRKPVIKNYNGARNVPLTEEDFLRFAGEYYLDRLTSSFLGRLRQREESDADGSITADEVGLPPDV